MPGHLSLYQTEDVPRLLRLREQLQRTERLRRQLQNAQRITPIREAKSVFRIADTPVFRNVASYRRIQHEMVRYLTTGLVVIDEGFDERIKSTAKMYEQWVFLQLAAAIRSLGLPCRSRNGLLHTSQVFRFDIGITTQQALSRFERTGDANISGDTSERASGNGSIMRLAPVPIRYAHLFPDQLDELVGYCTESSRPTHASPQCLSACAYFGLILAGLINGVDRDEVLSPEWGPLAQLKQFQPLHPEILEVADGSFREKQPPEIKGSGYVVRSLEAALWAFHDARDFPEAVLRAVNLGDDADTTGAVCGQLAGAYWGESGIPTEWLAGLARKEMIEDALGRLLSPKAQ